MAQILNVLARSGRFAVSSVRRFSAWWLARFRAYGWRGKSAFGCLSLLFACILCFVPQNR